MVKLNQPGLEAALLDVAAWRVGDLVSIRIPESNNSAEGRAIIIDSITIQHKRYFGLLCPGNGVLWFNIVRLAHDVAKLNIKRVCGFDEAI